MDYQQCRQMVETQTVDSTPIGRGMICPQATSVSAMVSAVSPGMEQGTSRRLLQAMPEPEPSLELFMEDSSSESLHVDLMENPWENQMVSSWPLFGEIAATNTDPASSTCIKEFCTSCKCCVPHQQGIGDCTCGTTRRRRGSTRHICCDSKTGCQDWSTPGGYSLCMQHECLKLTQLLSHVL